MKPIVRIPLATLVTTVAISLGVVGVKASTQCVRFVQKVRHHKVSAATAARWAAWDKAHPNWHPKKTPKETLAQLDFACQVPVETKPVDQDLPSLQIAGFDFPMDMLPPPQPPTIIAMDTPPPTLFPERSPSIVSPPIYSPQYPTLFGSVVPAVVPVGATPEPSSWMMLATALLGLAAMLMGRPRRSIALARGRR